MSYTLTLDFETHDPAIAERKGAGWVFKDFDVLGMAYKINDQPSEFTTDQQQMKDLVANSKSIIAHNSQYDIGCLKRLGCPYESVTIIDTIILAKLYDNTLFSYSLDRLGSDFLGIGKDYAALEEAAAELGLNKYMTNMRLLFNHRPDLVAQYAKQDVDITYGLAQWFKKELYADALNLIPFYSDLIKALVLWRSKGVLLDLEQAEKSSAALTALEHEAREEFRTYCGDINIESTKQLAQAFRDLGLTPGTSAKGGDSVDSAWRSTQNHPAIVALDNAKKYQKLRREFVDGIVERSENGRIYPEINIMGAAETGRFSSSSPNIQQIPKRDKSAQLVTKIFKPDPGQHWFSLDFSSQEPRLQVHYAYLTKCSGADMLRASFLKNSQHDLHQQVADLAHIDRKTAKTINLGISYGMGKAKLGKALHLSDSEALALMRQYNKLTPYLSQLNKAVQDSGTAKGYIKTLLGRRLRMDFLKPYKALNKLIQGSAADQTAMALVQAYREGLNILFSVHDSLELSSADRKDATRLKEIMETVANLEVPCYTEILYGSSWGELSPLD